MHTCKGNSGLKIKLKTVWWKVSDYVRYDLKEIAFPSSLPDPPHVKKRRKLTLKERYLILKEASRLYAASWVRDIGPELRPNDYKKKREIEGELGEENANGKEKEPSTLEDLGKGNSGLKMKLKTVWRKVSDYVRYDLKEIAFPSSLPDPPHVKKRRKLTLKERYLILKEASRLYAASWVRDIGPELRPNDYKKKREIEVELGEENANGKEKEPSTLEDLAVAARGGMETLRPALQRVYMTRASAYKDALKSFIQGYQEGIQQTMEKTKDSKSSKDTDASNSKGPT